MRDKGLLAAAVMRPRNSYGALSLARIAAIYLVGIAKNHAFLDGNKRTAFLSAVTFLQVNRAEVTLGIEWVQHTEDAASGSEGPR